MSDNPNEFKGPLYILAAFAIVIVIAMIAYIFLMFDAGFRSF